MKHWKRITSSAMITALAFNYGLSKDISSEAWEVIGESQKGTSITATASNENKIVIAETDRYRTGSMIRSFNRENKEWEVEKFTGFAISKLDMFGETVVASDDSVIIVRGKDDSLWRVDPLEDFDRVNHSMAFANKLIHFSRTGTVFVTDSLMQNPDTVTVENGDVNTNLVGYGDVVAHEKGFFLTRFGWSAGKGGHSAAGVHTVDVSIKTNGNFVLKKQDSQKIHRAIMMDDTLYAFGNDNMYLSSDMGNNWFEGVDRMLPPGSDSLSFFHYCGTSNGYLFDARQDRIHFSKDNATSWSAVMLPDTFNNSVGLNSDGWLSFHDDYILFTTPEKVYSLKMTELGSSTPVVEAPVATTRGYSLSTTYKKMTLNNSSSKPVSLKLFTPSGRQILERAAAMQHSVDISQLAHGVYLTEITETSGRTRTLQFIKE